MAENISSSIDLLGENSPERQTNIEFKVFDSKTTKRHSKARSKVWEKVAWFTRKTKAGKENKNGCPRETLKACKSRGNNLCSTEDFRRHDSCFADGGSTSTLNHTKSKQKSSVKKARSFNYLKRKKLGNYNLNTEYAENEMKENDDSKETATGTFYDFESGRRSSRSTGASCCSILNEMAKEVNTQSPHGRETTRCSLSLTMSLLSIGESERNSANMNQTRSQTLQVRTAGPMYNSWPRKKRNFRSSNHTEAFSPPQKQKRMSNLRKTATFSGIDKLGRNDDLFICYRLRDIKSSPSLDQQDRQIKNQNGLTVGVIHFFKSPTNATCTATYGSPTSLADCNRTNCISHNNNSKDGPSKSIQSHSCSVNQDVYDSASSSICQFLEKKGNCNSSQLEILSPDLLDKFIDHRDGNLTDEIDLHRSDTRISSRPDIDSPGHFEENVILRHNDTNKLTMEESCRAARSENHLEAICEIPGAVEDDCENSAETGIARSELTENSHMGNISNDNMSVDGIKVDKSSAMLNEDCVKSNIEGGYSCEASDSGVNSLSAVAAALESNQSLKMLNIEDVPSRNSGTMPEIVIPSTVPLAHDVGYSVIVDKKQQCSTSPQKCVSDFSTCEMGKNIDATEELFLETNVEFKEETGHTCTLINKPRCNREVPMHEVENQNVIEANSWSERSVYCIQIEDTSTDFKERKESSYRINNNIDPQITLTEQDEKAEVCWMDETIGVSDIRISLAGLDTKTIETRCAVENTFSGTDLEYCTSRDAVEKCTTKSKLEIFTTRDLPQDYTSENSQYKPSTDRKILENCETTNELRDDGTTGHILSNSTASGKTKKLDQLVSDRKLLTLSKKPIHLKEYGQCLSYTTRCDNDRAQVDFNNGFDIANVQLNNKAALLKEKRPSVNGQQFKQQTEEMLNWFSNFNNDQKNIFLRKILDKCELPQMHMLSVIMEPALHKTCPSNCQDMLAWLPHPVTENILAYLDPVSLCQCSQVNRFWNNLASSPWIWKQLCRRDDWQLSRSATKIQSTKYTLPSGTVQWKKMFAERFLLRRNWLNGRYKVRTFEGHTQGISCVQFDDTRIVSGSSDKTIKVWDLSRDESHAVLTLAGHSGTVRCLNLNGNRLVSGSVDKSIKVWDLSFESYWSGASCKVTMVGHMHTVRCLQVDDHKVVSGSYDKTLKVWDIKTGHCKLTLRGHNAAVLCVQFDDSKIVSGSYDNTIKVWSLHQGECLMTLTGHHDAVTCLNLTQDGRKVISGSLDHNLKFWDLATGKCIGTLDWIRSEGHTGVIRCLQSDSWRIVSAGDDKTLKMWSLETGQRLLTLRCHTDGVTCLQFNDFTIVSGSYDKTVKVWSFSPDHEFLNSS